MGADLCRGGDDTDGELVADEMNSYMRFLETKKILDLPSGIQNGAKFNPKLFDFQTDIVRWALRRGRAAIFADCGLGKTAMQLEWAKHLPDKVLILAPLAVSHQTVREGEKFGVPCAYAPDPEHITERITVTNYERFEKFNPHDFCGVVLDESSILKSFDGKMRTALIDSFAKTPYRLACTATPAPNDHMELGNHSEFLGVLNRSEMLSMFFCHDGGETQVWRLKGHARKAFWEWVCSWAVMLRKPSDVGYKDSDFSLPELRYHHKIVDVEKASEGYLFALEAQGLGDRLRARRDSIEDRVKVCSELVNAKRGQWLIWCHMNKESEQLTAAIEDAVEVKGSDSNEHKEKSLLDFASGKIRVMVSKPSIAGFGMNFQKCNQMAFVGLSDSYEELYQAVRRCWRFGQDKAVDVYLISASTEGAVIQNIQRKDKEATTMAEEMVKAMGDLSEKALHSTTQRTKSTYAQDEKSGEAWRMILGDSVEVLNTIEPESVHYSVFSPPFASLYTYSNSERDLGNCKTHGEFFDHFDFIIQGLFKAIIPGHLVSVHCMNLPTSKTNHGYIGIRDFRGDIIRAFEKVGWIYHSEVCIWKDPVTAMQRTKALGLLHKQIKKDSCMSRQGIPDYLVTFRKPGENPSRVTHTNESFPVSRWQQYASPVWMDINPSDTLQHRSAREHEDERHICPLQLQVIERAIELWTNPNDVVLSPFAGIGSEGFVSVKNGRKFIGIELKRSYFDQAWKNLTAAEEEVKSTMLFA